LAAGITRLLAAGGAPLRAAQTYAQVIGHLLGYDFAQDLALEARADSAIWVQDQAYAGLARLMTAATRRRRRGGALPGRRARGR
jgi:hypothetical protein